ncbi:MAG TPA: penicillin-binding protein 1C [Saprospiraceae bacterium]|jgi:penicillin-binding protein 1C|nr:penicillin-binding protein 1C [Saprospiraceae bacterium]
MEIKVCNSKWYLLKPKVAAYFKLLLKFTVLLMALILLLPLPKLKPSYSKILYSKEGTLLAASISDEQQWCFPLDGAIPEKLKKCIVTYEDEYMDWHPGINPVAVIKSLVLNIRYGKVKRGASTLSMQVMRMKNKHAERSWINKIRETLGSIKYSLLNADDSILREWCEIAPFGGNTIGIKAASLRYFGRSLEKLSWSEYAMLAVMPNGPSSANLSINRSVLLQKRNLLLRKLKNRGFFDENELAIYMDEDMPFETKSLPQYGYHALSFLSKKYPEKHIFYSTISYDQQVSVMEMIERESSFLKMDDIRNMACVVIDVQENKLIAYQGNVPNTAGAFSYVDIVQAPRSYGSLLKPLLYAHALESAHFLPQELIADIPTFIGDFQPENFDKKYRGAVPFDEMLVQSLNVPAVRVLNTVGLQSFYDLIRRLNLAYLDKGAGHYGLSIILGGGETTLWDMSRIYKGLAQNYSGQPDPFREVQILQNKDVKSPSNVFRFSPYTISHVVNTMSDLTRPREEKSWNYFSPDYKVAWKTGTSYGNKDAWALGFNGKYMVGIWVGNEGGEGRFDLTGISKAAPVMFKIFNLLPDNQWFGKPPTYSNKLIIKVCDESGKLAGPLCKHQHSLITENTSYKYQPCNYHKDFAISANGLALDERCENLATSRDTFFVLPSYMEYYYIPSHGEYRGMPEYNPECRPDITAICKIIYPYDDLKIFLPKENPSESNEMVVKAYHKDKNAILYWFLDDQFVRITKSMSHELMVGAKPGSHILTINDQWGNYDQIDFEILKRE